MKLNLDLTWQKQVALWPVTLARLSGNVDLDVIAEPVTQNRARKMIIQALRDSELNGIVEVGGEKVDISTE